MTLLVEYIIDGLCQSQVYQDKKMYDTNYTIMFSRPKRQKLYFGNGSETEIQWI